MVSIVRQKIAVTIGLIVACITFNNHIYANDTTDIAAIQHHHEVPVNALQLNRSFNTRAMCIRISLSALELMGTHAIGTFLGNHIFNWSGISANKKSSVDSALFAIILPFTMFADAAIALMHAIDAIKMGIETDATTSTQDILDRTLKSGLSLDICSIINACLKTAVLRMAIGR